MRNNLLFTLALCSALTSASSLYADVNVDKPQITKFVEFNQSEGGEYYVYNTRAGLFLTAGNAYGTQASLAETAYKLVVSQTTDAASSLSGWTFEFPKEAPGNNGGKPKYLFVYQGGTDAFIDYNLNGTYLWKIQKQDNGSYRISVIDEAPEHGSNELGYDTYMGQMNTDLASEGLDNTVVQPMLNPDIYDLEQQKKMLLDWSFVSPEDYDIYSAKRKLYSVLERADEVNYTETSSYEELYNNPDVTSESLLAASDELNDKIDSFIYDSVSEDNPMDMTSFISCPSFVDKDGNRSSGSWASNSMYMDQNREGVDYYGVEESDRVIDDFVDCWVSPSSGIQYCAVWQGIRNLPAGKYSLSADFIASQVADPTLESKGVYIVADGGMGELTKEVKMSDFSGKGKTVTIDFNVVDDANVVIGARAANSNVNWMIVDNFRLTYYGKKTEIDMAKEDLQKAINDAETLYDMEIVQNGKACSNIGLERFNTILNLSKEAYVSQEIDKDSVIVLRNNLQKQSERFLYDINLYNGEEFSNKITSLYTKINENPIYSEDEFFFNKTESFITETETLYGELNFDPEKFDSIDIIVDSLYKDDIMIALKSGITTNATGLLQSYDFSGDVAPGWVGSPSISWGIAEAYNRVFDINTSLKDLPKGSYKITMNGFYRPGTNEVCANGDEQVNKICSHLYANESTSPVHHLYDVLFDTPPLVNEENQPIGCVQLVSNNPDLNEKYVINDRQCTYNVISNDPSLYLNEVVCYVDESGELKMGVKTIETPANHSHWTAFDNFKIEYLGEDNYTGFKSTVETLISKVDAILTSYSISAVDDPLLMKSLPLDVEIELSSAKDKANNEILATDDFTLEQAEDNIKNLNTLLLLADSVLNKSQMLVDEYVFAMEVTAQTESEYTGYYDCMTEYEQVAISGLESLSVINEWIVRFKSEYSSMMMYGKTDDVTKDNPADLTSVIVNPGFEKINPETGEVINTASGWVSEGQPPYISNSFVEFWQQNYDLSQEIYGLPSGYYRLQFNGFYRYANPVDDAVRYRDSIATDNSIVYVKGGKELYVKPVMSISAGATDTPLTSTYFNIGDSLYIGDDIENAPAKYTPGHKTDARVAFDAGHYLNELYFKVDKDQKSVIIGMQNENFVPNDWTIIDSFKLTYYGDGDDNMPDNVELPVVTDNMVISTSYYTIAGYEISKPNKRGFYIREDIMADGSKRTYKIYVK